MDSNFNSITNSNNCNNCSGCSLVGLAASLAIFIDKQFQFDADELATLAAFITALGDNLALLATSK